MRHTTTMLHKTRESWLVAAIAPLRKLLLKAGAPVFPEPLVSVGLPSKRALSHKTQRVGECWHERHANGRSTIFVSPVLADPKEILAVLLHELIHAAVGIDAGHRETFATIAVDLGFQRPLSATNVGPRLKPVLDALAKKLGTFPHDPLKDFVNPIKKAATRLRLYMCNKCQQKIRAGSDTLQVMHIHCGGVFLLKDAPDAHKVVVFKRSLAPELRRAAGAMLKPAPPRPAAPSSEPGKIAF